MGYAAAWRGGDERSCHGIPSPPPGGPRAPVSFGPNDLFWDSPRPRKIHWLHWAPHVPPQISRGAVALPRTIAQPGPLGPRAPRRPSKSTVRLIPSDLQCV